MGEEVEIGKITFYVARHAYATHSNYNNVNTSIISEALGHQEVQITQVYLDDFGNDVLDGIDEELL